MIADIKTISTPIDSTGRLIRQDTRVIFDNGNEITFTKPMAKLEARLQALRIAQQEGWEF